MTHKHAQGSTPPGSHPLKFNDANGLEAVEAAEARRYSYSLGTIQILDCKPMGG